MYSLFFFFFLIFLKMIPPLMFFFFLHFGQTATLDRHPVFISNFLKYHPTFFSVFIAYIHPGTYGLYGIYEWLFLYLIFPDHVSCHFVTALVYFVFSKTGALGRREEHSYLEHVYLIKINCCSFRVGSPVRISCHLIEWFER